MLAQGRTECGAPSFWFRKNLYCRRDITQRRRGLLWFRRLADLWQRRGRRGQLASDVGTASSDGQGQRRNIRDGRRFGLLFV